MEPVPPKSIVLVDDEKSYAELLTQMLAENLDCPVRFFSRPLDALANLPQVHPAVVVTDFHMPQLDGIAFIREATKIVPTATFVMITGHDLSAREDELKQLTQLRGFLPKPFGWKKLSDEIFRAWPAGVPTPRFRADLPSL